MARLLERVARSSLGPLEPIRSKLVANRPHPYLEAVQRAVGLSDFPPMHWSIKVPRDGFMLALAHEEATKDGALWVRPLGAGTIIVSGFASLFSNRALGLEDNARLLANIVASTTTPAGAVIFDDEHQGLSAVYDPAKFYKDGRLYATLGIIAAVWLVWVLGGTQLPAPATRVPAPQETQLVRDTGLFLARVLRPAAAARRLFENFFLGIRGVLHDGRDAEEAALWAWLEQHPRLATSDVAQLKSWYTQAYAGREGAAGAPAQPHRPNRKATHRMSTSIQQLESLLARELGRVVVGTDASLNALIIALLARGHVLVQGIPGLGKTLLAKTLARALGGEFKRIQGTADLMPSDITGVSVFDEITRAFNFRPGPLFADVVLVDEINRTGPKTQSALLEAMEERQVSVDRSTFELPPDFLLIATQNPREFEGTYPLPESQLDRFMLRLDMQYPARAAEAEILSRYGGMGTAAQAALASVTAIDRALLGAARATSRRYTCRMRSARTCSTWRLPLAGTRALRSAFPPAGHWRCSRRRAFSRHCAVVNS